MGMNFPNAPSEGDLYQPAGGYIYAFSNGVWRIVEDPQRFTKTAQRRNRMLNPAFQVSQENGSTGAVSTAYYVGDQWAGTCSITPGTVYMVRHPSITSPLGSVNRAINEVVVINAAPTGSQWMGFYQKLEGQKIADFMWGTPQARQVILRFGVRCGVAGTFGGALRGTVAGQTYPFSYTISAAEVDKDVYRTIVVPGCPAGAWPVDNTVGIEMWWTFATSATYQAPAGAWTASGTPIGCTGMTNGMAVTAKQFHLFDVGLYLDPDNTGVPPPWEMPDEAAQLQACMRYFEIVNGGNSILWSGSCTSAVTFYQSVQWKVQKRILPAVSAVVGSQSAFPAAIGTLLGNVEAVREARIASATSTSGYFYCASYTGNARM